MESSNSSKVENSIGYSSSSSSSSSNALKKARLQSMLSALLEDPVLSDIPKKPSLSDVETLINLEMGSAMKISVLKMDDTSFDVAVSNSATVKDLKLAIKRKRMKWSNHRWVTATFHGMATNLPIIWRHVWANFCLSHHNEKLIDDNAILQDFGIRNSSQVRFVPCVVSRVTQRHSRRKKHRFFHGLSKRL